MCEEPFVAAKKISSPARSAQYLRPCGVVKPFLFGDETVVMLFTPFRAWVDATCDVSCLLSC